MGCTRCYLSLIDVLFMTSCALKSVINKRLQETKAKERQMAMTVLHQKHPTMPSALLWSL